MAYFTVIVIFSLSLSYVIKIKRDYEVKMKKWQSLVHLLFIIILAFDIVFVHLASSQCEQMDAELS